MSIGIRLTKNGKKVLAQGLLGEEIHFTRVGIGSGNFDYDTEKVYDLEELREFQMWLPLVEKKIIGDGTVYIKAYLSNAEVTKGFPATEHGVFAIDPATGEEILYGYKNLGDEYDFIPSASGSALKNVFVSYIVEIRDCENITATLDLSVAYINTTDFQEHLDDPHPHLNAPCHYDDVQTTSEIWATDSGDNHLHKISVENLRELVADKSEKQSEQNIITAAQNELGLVSNVLMIEDFCDETVTDYFVTVVKSAAEHGALLGVETPQNLRTGGRYILSDGVSSEQVQISSVMKNQSGYYAKLAAPIANTFQKNLRLYRSTAPPCEKKSVTWEGATFSGVRANITRTAELDTAYLQIDGDGALDSEGFFTLF